MVALPQYLLAELEKIAQNENRSAAEVLESMLKHYKKPERITYATLADLAQSALEADFHSPEMTDTAERSRDIIQNEYADYLKRRMGDDGRPSSD